MAKAESGPQHTAQWGDLAACSPRKILKIWASESASEAIRNYCKKISLWSVESLNSTHYNFQEDHSLQHGNTACKFIWSARSNISATMLEHESRRKGWLHHKWAGQKKGKVTEWERRARVYGGHRWGETLSQPRAQRLMPPWPTTRYLFVDFN